MEEVRETCLWKKFRLSELVLSFLHSLGAYIEDEGEVRSAVPGQDKRQAAAGVKRDQQSTNQALSPPFLLCLHYAPESQSIQVRLTSSF